MPSNGNGRNRLFYGDNLEVLRRHVKDETVDLVYLDPPFQSNRNYNILFQEKDGTRAAAQIKAFTDTWKWDQAAEISYQETVEAGGRTADALESLRRFLGESDMMAYLAMMAPRLVELRRVLKPTGSLYLHCDPTASHYLKMLMDGVFGPERFLNEIVWCYNVGGKGSRHWAKKHDVLLFYAKGSDWHFDGLAVGIKRDTGSKSFGGKMGVDEKGRRYQDKLVKATGKYYRYYLDEPKIPEDWWVGMNSIQSQSSERLGYPTQKPEVLLERIIKASSKPGDLVLDPFCGCGTAVSVAQRLERRWIGIDITHLALNLIKHRLADAFGDSVRYKVKGEPVSISGAEALAKEDPYQFQFWSLGLVGARPAEEKKGADKGIDGRRRFFDDDSGDAKQIIFSVKAGHLTVPYVRDLRGVLVREGAELGAFISMKDPTGPMRKEAATAGFYKSPWDGKDYPRLQLLTVPDLLRGKKPDFPPMNRAAGTDPTFKRAPRVKDDKGKTGRLV